MTRRLSGRDGRESVGYGVSRFRELAADYEAIAALSLWVDAAQTRRGVAAAIEATRQVLEDRQKKAIP